LRTGKHLTFLLDDEVYGIEILKIREIIGIMDITPVPQAPPYLKGVVNLRGKIIPVVDLRLRFGFPERPHDERTCIIVVELASKEGRVSVGIIVDSVSEVAHISEADVEETPELGDGFDAEYILGMAKLRGRVVILIDIGKVLSGGPLGQFAA
jgi:purine-binding chemotaxis protein CheW